MKALIEKKVLGCGKIKYEDEKQELRCGYKEVLCSSCKSYLQGIKDSLKDELEFLKMWHRGTKAQRGDNYSKEDIEFEQMERRMQEISELIKLLEGKGI